MIEKHFCKINFTIGVPLKPGLNYISPFLIRLSLRYNSSLSKCIQFLVNKGFSTYSIYTVLSRDTIKSMYRDAIKRISQILFERCIARVVDILLTANFDFKGFENQFKT